MVSRGSVVLDGTVHDHTHDHHESHAHMHEAPAGRTNLTPWALFIIFVLGPCEPLIPLFVLPASRGDWALAGATDRTCRLQRPLRSSTSCPNGKRVGRIVPYWPMGGRSADPNIEVQILSYGYARAKKGFMAMAVVPAAKMALEKAGLGIEQMKAIKTHNPFAANDIYLADQMNIDVMGFNNYGCSLIFGHPQAPTAGRSIIEGIEEVAMAGGGYLLFSGCAAGDTGAALVLKIGK